MDTLRFITCGSVDDGKSPFIAELMDTIRAHLRTDWPDFAIVEVTQALVELAGEYADTYALRVDDGVQLTHLFTVCMPL